MGLTILRHLWNGARYLAQRRWVLASRPFIWVMRFRFRWVARVPGATVLIANWRTTNFLSATVPRILSNSPEGTRVIVVDNASPRHERAALRSLPPSVRVVRLPVNVGHGVALDVAAMLARTDFIVSLDVDAFPIDPTWLDHLADPLRSGEATVSGAGGSRGQIAPCCLMITLDRFLDARHTFTPRFVPGNDRWLIPSAVWDVGRSISIREGVSALHRLERTGYLDPVRRAGEIFGDVIYHNGYATIDLAPGNRGSMTKVDAMEVWSQALIRFQI